MFKINLKPLKSTIRTIDQEMNQTRARYAKYLEETSRDFVAKRSNVEIRDPHTMAGNSYWELRDKIDPINDLAKKAGKNVKFEDARALIRGDEFASATIENRLSSEILVTTLDKKTGITNYTLIDRLKYTADEFLVKIADFIKAPIKP